MSDAVLAWWILLNANSVLNLLVWWRTARWLDRRRASLGDAAYRARRTLLWLAGAYMAGCAFRALLPVHEVSRTCLVDSILSSPLIARSVATVAELCFVAQWAILLQELGRATASAPALAAARLILPLILVAEAFSWYAALTTSNLGHVVEESLWGAAALLAVGAMVAAWPSCGAVLRSLLAVCCAAGLAYVQYMFMIDVPRYWARWIEADAAGRVYLSLLDGLVDAARRCVVAGDWPSWREEIPWMSMYFSLAVWISIALVRVPALARRSRPRGRPRVVIAAHSATGRGPGST